MFKGNCNKSKPVQGLYLALSSKRIYFPKDLLTFVSWWIIAALEHRVLLKVYSSINADRSNNGAIRFIALDPGMYVSYKSYSYICPTDIFGINFKIATEYYRCYTS
jgi:hypothetical protein